MPESDSQARIASLVAGLQEAGWIAGRNITIDVRWGGGDFARLRQDATDLIAIGCDVIVGGVGPALPILQQATSTVPVVMAQARSIPLAPALCRACRGRAVT